MFDNIFIRTGKKLADQIVVDPNYTPKCRTQSNSFYLSHTSRLEVLQVLNSSKNNKS